MPMFLTHLQFVYTLFALFWFFVGILNIDKMNVIASGWFVYGHINKCVWWTGHGWNQGHIIVLWFGLWWKLV